MPFANSRLKTVGVTGIKVGDDVLQGTVPIVGVSGASIMHSGNTIQFTASAAPDPTSEYDAGNSGASKTIDWANGSCQKLTMSAACEITLTGAVSGNTYILRVVQPALTAYRPSFLANTVFFPIFNQNSVAPLLEPEAQTLYRFYYDGSVYKADPIQNFPGRMGISAGRSFIQAVDSLGFLWGWGTNTQGQLGDQSLTSRSTPVTAAQNILRFSSVSAGLFHSVALEANSRRVFASGRNAEGQLGINSTTDQSLYIALAGGGFFSQITAGAINSYALEQGSGILFGWGDNLNGQIGDNSTTTRSSPVSVAGTRLFSRLAWGSWGDHFGAIEFQTGRAFTWGNNSNGQLGDGSLTTRSSPVSVSSTRSFIQMAGGSLFMLALQGSDGLVYAWGNNASGQLGDGTITERSAPVQAASVTASMIQIAAGASTGYGLDSTGKIWAWGKGNLFQLGDNSAPVSRSSAVTLSTTRSFCQVSADDSGMAYAVEIGTHTVWAWGFNETLVWDQNLPILAQSPVSLARTQSQSVLLEKGTTQGGSIDAQGVVWHWGYAQPNLVLTATPGILERSPVSVAYSGRSFTQIAQVQTGDGEPSTILAAIEAGTGLIWTWGSATLAAALGRASGTSTGTIAVGVSFTRLSGGTSHFVALAGADGRIYSWGSNAAGQLGDNSTTAKTTPDLIARTASYSRLAAGLNMSVALDASDGSAWSWGSGTSGVLGNSTTTAVSSPVSVSGGHSFTEVSAGFFDGSASPFVVALRGDATAWVWGAVQDLGGGGATKSTPVSVTGGKSFTKVSAGGLFIAALEAGTGNAYAWGLNTYGQLGDGSTTTRSTPVSVQGGRSYTQIACGMYTTYAIEGSSGIIYAWGRRTYGTLGNNTSLAAATPVSIGRVFS